MENNGLPGHWRKVSLKEINRSVNQVINPLDYPGEVFEYYSIPAFQDGGQPILEPGGRILSNKLLIKDSTVLFGKLNPRVLKVWLVSSDSQHRKIASTEFLPICPSDEAIPLFLFYLCQSATVVSEAQRLVSGSTPSRQRVDPKSFYEIEVLLPPRPQQQAIAHALRSVQQAIEARRLEIALEWERKAALMEQLFTYGTRGEPLKKTEIGEMPKSWQVILLGDVIVDGPQNGLYKPQELYGGGTPIIRINDFNNYGAFVTFQFNRVHLQSEEVERYCVREGDLLINRVNSLSHLGKCTLVPKLSETTVFESNMMRFHCDESIVLPSYLLRYLVSEPSKERIRGMARRAVAQSSINQGDVSSISVPLPSLGEQREMVEVLERCDAKTSSLHREASLFDELFKALLEELMTGRLSAVPLIEEVSQ